MVKWFKSRGFTERLYIINFIMVWLFVWGCFLASLFSGKLGVTDLSALGIAISCSFGELAIWSGFLVWKNKTENISKFGNKDNIMM